MPARPSRVATVLVLYLVCSSGAPAANTPESQSEYAELERAAALIAQGKLSEAESKLQPILSTTPSEYQAWNLLGVVRAQQDIERIQTLINQGALPAIRLRQAQNDLEIAKDMSILRVNIYSKDLLPEQAEQMVVVAQRIVLRRLETGAKTPIGALTTDGNGNFDGTIVVPMSLSVGEYGITVATPGDARCGAGSSITR